MGRPSTSSQLLFLGMLVAVSLVVGLNLAEAAPEQSSRIRIMVRAFIPQTLPWKTKGFHQGSTGLSWLPGPTPTDQCFLTDQRAFSTDSSSDSRVSTDFVMLVSANSVRIEGGPHQRVHFPGQTTKVECATGKLAETRTNVLVAPPGSGSQAPAEYVAIKMTAAKAQVSFAVAASNPFLTSRISPPFDYELTLQFDPATRLLSFRGQSSRFPSYEGYAQLDNTPAVTLFRLEPTAGNVLAQYDYGVRIAPRLLSGSVRLTGNSLTSK